jgi:hypothetical protein
LHKNGVATSSANASETGFSKSFCQVFVYQLCRGSVSPSLKNYSGKNTISLDDDNSPLTGTTNSTKVEGL